jgi:hypothetical protein
VESERERLGVVMGMAVVGGSWVCGGVVVGTGYCVDIAGVNVNVLCKRVSGG